jgi:hypothetical protein
MTVKGPTRIVMLISSRSPIRTVPGMMRLLARVVKDHVQKWPGNFLGPPGE